MLHTAFFWKRSPFLRLVCPLIAGISWRYYYPSGISFSLSIAVAAMVLAILATKLQPYLRFRLYWLNALFIHLILFCFGATILWYHDKMTREGWIKNPDKNEPRIAVIEEPLSEKANSFKTIAIINHFQGNGQIRHCSEKILLYFEKNGVEGLGYGDIILFKSPLQPVKHTGNPGAFDFRRYCLFQGIQHQVFLKKSTYKTLRIKQRKWYKELLIRTRAGILEVLRHNISGRKEYGLAEAILIGHKDDLDRDLVKSYSETGVTHVIAISGLHLGIIYFILNYLSGIFLKASRLAAVRVGMILSGLWLFSLLTGASASVLRSALMFSCLLIGNSAGKKSPAINSLAAAAFLLLCYNPYLVWDIGFQLSFAAVLSILIFEKRVYNLLYIKNRGADLIWKMCSVTIAAQILTTPVSIFHFHQFPLLFLFTNIIAIPLSSIILIGEIILCVISFLPALAGLVGAALHWLIVLMNSIVGYSGAIPFSSWKSLQISFLQLVALYGFTGALYAWFQSRSPGALTLLAGSWMLFFSLRFYSFKKAAGQKALLVYQVQGKKAIEFIDGRYYYPIYDSLLLKDEAGREFHMAASHILHRINAADSLKRLRCLKNIYMFCGKKILILDHQPRFRFAAAPKELDVLILSGNAPVRLDLLLKYLKAKLIIFDSSNSVSRIRNWTKDCKSLGLRYYSVPDNGAVKIRFDRFSGI
jgi:competence protein ComEC